MCYTQAEIYMKPFISSFVIQRMKLICIVLLLLAALVVGESDVDSLLELKKGILNDPSGKVLVSWDSQSLESDGCPKNWYGISCSEGRVTSIALSDLSLVGEFRVSAISGLQMLRNFSISNNQLNGTVAKEVGLIASLESFDISRNFFGGTIPSELTSLKKLNYLDLHGNGFVGDVMSILGELDAVEYVDLSSNNFSGLLDLGIGNPDFVSSVRNLNISHNNLTGELFPHDGIPYFDSLEVFDASDNHFVGNVPSFSFVVSLRVIKLSNNQLSGSLPQGLLQESSMILSELDLSNNQLEGPLASISSVNLRNLNLSSNKLSGPLPPRIGHCAVIDLSNNTFSGNLSRILSWGNYVERIDVSSNQLTGILPNQTSQFLRLTSLKISNNSIEGVLPPVLGKYPELEAIDLSHNKISGFLLATLFNLTKLTVINLSSNNFSGTIPSDAITVQNYSLVSLDLSHNTLTGPLPPELGRFQNMVYLDLSNNKFEGGIPDDLPETIVGFNVSYNNLSGVVPKTLQRFPSSSFHPGNLLLVLPNDAPSSEGGNSLSLRGHSSRVKSAIRTALIAGLVGIASIITIMALVIYCRARQNKKTSTETGGKKVLSSVGAESSNLPGFVPSSVQRPKDPIFPESARKSEVASSPLSVASPANASPKDLLHQYENPNALRGASPDKLAGDLHLFDISLKFTAQELSSAPAEAIGMSCHGTLYKAVLASGYVLAVKLLKEGIAKGRKEFAREAKKLGNIRHPNLVSLQGFYWGPKEHEKLIISKYIDAPCLAHYLHGTAPGSLPPLSLDTRLKIALDVARCLTYLHNESAIPHGNLKSTNIMIELTNFNALVTDYSLHRLLTPAGTADQVLNAGALGYRPPEFTSTSKPCPSLKSDVYAFGVILLELLTGRSSADIVPGSPEVVKLAEWVSLLAAENRAVECFDLRILGKGSGESILRVLDAMLGIALKCILPADERSDMKMIFEEIYSLVL